MRRDERAISGILEELIALAIVSMALCLLLTAMASRAISGVDTQTRIVMRKDARDLLERIVSDSYLGLDKDYLMLDGAVLRNVSLQELRGVLQTSYEFRLIIHDVSNSADYIFQTAEPAGDVMGAMTSCNIWMGPEDIHAARVTILVWRG